MHIVIGVPLGLIVTIGVVLWFVISARQAAAKKRKLELLRAKQAVARERALEKALRPPLIERVKSRFWQR